MLQWLLRTVAAICSLTKIPLCPYVLNRITNRNNALLHCSNSIAGSNETSGGIMMLADIDEFNTFEFENVAF